jgi:uncharacterized membrane protein YphA (DoxX/SURF4 family)
MPDQLARVLSDCLGSRVAWFLARLLLVGAYVVGGITKLADWPAAVAEQAYFGMSPPAVWAILTIAVELVGAGLILSGRLVWLGAGLLGGFTLVAAFVANDFWTMADEARFHAVNAFFEHLGLVGAFILAARLAPPRPVISADG